jgi:hypothetical protein
LGILPVTVIYTMLGIAAGLAGGFFGIGGAIVVIPGLVFLAEFSQKTAQGTTLLMMLPPIGALAAWEYARRGEVSWQAALYLCFGFLAGSWLGARGAGAVPHLVLQRAFGVLMILIGLRMLFKT